jgi:plastocyanin
VKPTFRALSCILLLSLVATGTQTGANTGAHSGEKSGAQENHVLSPVPSPVTLKVVLKGQLENAATTKKSADFSNVAVWLVPLDHNAATRDPSAPAKPPRLVQRNKTFEPHLLIVPVGAKVAFPNKDPFFHNIFSLYDGRRFDLGLYEAGTTRTVTFDRPGVSFLFCNIHAEMSAVVVAVNTPYFALSDRSGAISIPAVPDGRYQLNIWYEKSNPEYLKALPRVVSIAATTRDLGTVEILENPEFTPAHKNKYGLDYVPPPNSTYDQP